MCYTPVFLFKNQHERRCVLTRSAGTETGALSLLSIAFTIPPSNAFGATVLNLGCSWEPPKELLRTNEAKPHQSDSELIDLG